MEPRYALGNNIRALRQARGLTQAALALHCDMSSVEVSRAERGQRDLRVSTVVRIARGLQVSAAELLRGIR